MSDFYALYCDGGVIGKNPSEIGGTWAFCQINYGVVHTSGSSYITPAQARMPNITNNLTEMLAFVNGLMVLPDEWIGTVYSDSQITLGRAFLGWKWKNIPQWLLHDYQEQRRRLVNWEKIRCVLLQGHPTRAELAAGVGSRGYPVSEHNVWCDKECGRRAAEYLKMLEGAKA